MSEHKEFNDPASISNRTAQILHPLAKLDKSSALAYIIKRNSDGQAVVITKTKKSADTLYKFLKEQELNVAVVHGNSRIDHKEEMINSFKRGDLNIFITTDMILNTSGLEDLDCIISIDLPLDAEQYINRLESLNKDGLSVILFSEDEEKSLATIEWLIKAEIEQTEIEGYLPSAYSDEESVVQKDKVKKPRHKKSKSKSKNSKTEEKKKEEDLEG